MNVSAQRSIVTRLQLRRIVQVVVYRAWQVRKRIAIHESLPNCMAPRPIIFSDTVPLGTTGQVLKRLLRKEMEMGGEG